MFIKIIFYDIWPISINSIYATCKNNLPLRCHYEKFFLFIFVWQENKTMLALVSWHICINVIKHATFQVYSVYPAVVILKNLQLTTGIYTKDLNFLFIKRSVFPKWHVKRKNIRKKNYLQITWVSHLIFKVKPSPFKKICCTCFT